MIVIVTLSSTLQPDLHSHVAHNLCSLQSELRVGQSTNGSLRTELSSRSHNDVVTSVHFLCFGMILV
jgi:hypothetical protein